MEKTDRTDKLLALILLQGMKSATLFEKVHQLNLAGFTNLEIANILQLKSDLVSDALYRARRGTSRERKPG